MLRRTPLKRTGFLPRGAGLKPARPLKRTPAEVEGRAIVQLRSGGGCEVRVMEVCTGRAAEWQHRKNRSQGGTWAASNGLHSCPACHRWIHANPAAAAVNGWTVPRWADPATVPVEYPGWGRVLLGEHGAIHLVQEGRS